MMMTGGDEVPRGEKISPEVAEQIRAHYAMTGSLAKTARHFGVSSQTVMKFRDQDPDELEEMRTYNKEQFIKDAWDTLGLLFRSVEHKIPEAPLKEITTSIGIITDKLQLLQGEPTSRSDNTNKNTHSLDDISTEQAKMIVQMYAKGNGHE